VRCGAVTTAAEKEVDFLNRRPVAKARRTVRSPKKACRNSCYEDTIGQKILSLMGLGFIPLPKTILSPGSLGT
jgi:hypothetical protein